MEKRLYRSKKDRLIAGVCGGLAEYFNIDPVVVRLVFIAAIFVGGAGLVAYIVLAIVVPSADSVHNEPVQTIRENVEEIKTTAETFGRHVEATFAPADKTESHVKEPAKEAVTEKKETNPRAGMLIFGGILVGVGIIALFTNFGPFHWDWLFNWDYFWPAVLIVAGLLIIFIRKR